MRDFLIVSLWQDPNYEVHQVSCAEIKIEGVDAVLYGKLLTEAVGVGATFEGTRASISGLEFDWSYDQPSRTLRVTCLRKPFYANCEQVETRIRDLVEKAKGAL